MNASNKLFEGWVVQAWRKQDADARVIQIQKNIIILLFILSIAFFIGWTTSPSRMTVYLPPNIENGSTMKVGTIPEPLVYAFAYEIWQELNYWADETGEDYKKNILLYSAYLTPKFKSELLEDFSDLKVSGQTQRIRFIQGVSGAAYDPINVKKINNDTWEVDLTMRLTEMKNNQAVKDVEILFPLKVARTNIAPSRNPYGLSLAGFIAQPQRLQTYI